MPRDSTKQALHPPSEKNLSGYGAPSAGPPPWYVYKVTPETIFALGTAEPYGATRWQF